MAWWTWTEKWFHRVSQVTSCGFGDLVSAWAAGAAALIVAAAMLAAARAVVTPRLLMMVMLAFLVVVDERRASARGTSALRGRRVGQGTRRRAVGRRRGDRLKIEDD